MNWLIFTPELFFLASAGTFLGLSLLPADSRRDYLTAISLSAMGVGVCIAGVTLSGDLFRDTYRVDLFSQVFKTLLARCRHERARPSWSQYWPIWAHMAPWHLS